MNTSREVLLKGLLEGIGFEMKLNLNLLKDNGIPVHCLRAFGGGARNETWMQIRADILGVKIECLNIREAGCMGAALLAAQALMDSSSMSSCVDTWIRVTKVYQPDPERKTFYSQKFEVYKTLYELLSPVRVNVRTY